MAAPEIDVDALAAMAQDVQVTAQDADGLVKATAGPSGRIDEIKVEAELADGGAEAAAAEIMKVVNEAQRLADAEFNQRVQAHITAFITRAQGGQQ